MKSVFVDRDGVINRNRRDHVKSWDEFVFLPGAVDALVQLTRHGFRTVVLTNQAAVNRGILEIGTLEAIHERMVAALTEAGARIDGVFFCPHRPDEGCSCRKPRPGLLRQASDKLSIDLSQSYIIGDALTDVAAGREVGSRAILVLSGRGARQFLSLAARHQRGYTVSRDLQHAVRGILIAEGLVEPSLLERARLRLLSMAM